MKRSKYFIYGLMYVVFMGCTEMVDLGSEQNVIETQLSTRLNITLSTAEITVGTYNILSSQFDAQFPNNTWQDRKAAVMDIILQQDNNPDIIGIQDGMVTSQVNELDSLLGSDYDSFISLQVISPRAIFWKKDEFTLLATNVIDILGTNYSGSFSNTRYASYVRLRHNDTDKMLMVFNVHLPYGATETRQEVRYTAATILAGKAVRYSEEYFDYAPAIVLGDLNNYPETVIGGIPSSPAGLSDNGLHDTYNYTSNRTNKDYYTKNNMEAAKAWSGPDGSKRLDYIFTYPGSVTVNNWSNIINFANEPTLDLETPIPSDHHPVRSSINLPGRVTDIDGNGYNTIIIGNQEWMSENLKVSRYRDGSQINTGLNNTAWSNANNGAYSIYPHSGIDGIDSQEKMDAAYGKLYNWYAVNDARGLCPASWRVPTDEDWKELEQYLGMTQQDADDIGWRASGSTGWQMKTTARWYDNSGGTNEHGFSALPGGYRNGDNGSYDRHETYSYWWTATEYSGTNAFRRVLRYGYISTHRLKITKKEGSSVRCIKI